MGRRNAPIPAFDGSPRKTAVLVACKNGEATIGGVVRSAIDQADVFVVSDGSTDRTADVARQAGAQVLERGVSGGKPDALRAGTAQFRLTERYEYIAVLDDDTTIADDYVDRVTRTLDADPGVAVASGRIDSLWNHAQRWNPYVAMRAFMYWSYQATIKRGQNAFRVVNVICGANSIFRAGVFARLIEDDAPYAIDDMYWLAEIVRQQLGRVAYVHDAHSWTIDPHTFRDWYRQTVRWSWGQFQSIRGHRLGLPVQRDRTSRVGVRFSWFDLAYLALLIDWLPYMIEPLAIVPVAILLSSWIDPLWFAVFYFGTSLAWISIAAAAMRRPRLLLLAPAIIALDLVYRATMMHAAVKTVRQPRVARCQWDSPTRFDLEQDAPIPSAQ
jgi:cellulose synthase/poly-beta-1,6-N-acetylglucosamine synthase-like glycosyltransferase